VGRGFGVFAVLFELDLGAGLRMGRPAREAMTWDGLVVLDVWR